jgi:hypothetical protein
MTAPSPQTYYAGVGEVGADGLNTFVSVVANYAQMRTFAALQNMVCCALGNSTPNDGGQGHFYFNLGSGYVDNNSTIIVPYGYSGGAWLRLTGI